MTAFVVPAVTAWLGGSEPFVILFLIGDNKNAACLSYARSSAWYASRLIGRCDCQTLFVSRSSSSAWSSWQSTNTLWARCSGQIMGSLLEKFAVRLSEPSTTVHQLIVLGLLFYTWDMGPRTSAATRGVALEAQRK